MARENKVNADTGEVIESGKWNASKSYTDYMIFKPLYDAAMYEQVARFGSTDIVEQLSLNEKSQPFVRDAAINRLLFTLQQLVINSKFSIQDDDKPHLEDCRKKLDYIQENLISKVSELKRKGDSTKTEINEKIFNDILNYLQSIREEMSQYIDNADLIYFSKEPEMTEEERDRWIYDRAVNQG
ncbi:MAG: DUF1186 domain-containing protein [Candidatus Pacearchaeota archaeon]